VKACVDVHYREASAVAACVLFEDWTAERPERELVTRIPTPGPYEPGQFHRRELPCLLAVLEPVGASLETIIIDGYVRLDEGGRPGLGARLHQALGGRVPVIGVAKTAFGTKPFGVPVCRGTSRRPLYVTAVGMEDTVAADRIRALHGSHRIPTLLARADRLARTASGV
jgi:deoxyribonuclease V